MHRKNSLHRVRMRKNKRVLRGIGQGAKFLVYLIALCKYYNLSADYLIGLSNTAKSYKE